MPREPITITLPDGSTRDGTSYETSPMSIALAISKGLADKTVIAKVRALRGFRSRTGWSTAALTPVVFRRRSTESCGTSSGRSKSLPLSNCLTLSTPKVSEAVNARSRQLLSVRLF